MFSNGVNINFWVSGLLFGAKNWKKRKSGKKEAMPTCGAGAELRQLHKLAFVWGLQLVMGMCRYGVSSTTCGL